jgi:nucleoside-diphosphate-sugar epimerase
MTAATVLVTGVTGDLGRALLDALSPRHRVIGSDVGPDGPPGIDYRQADATKLDDLLAVVTPDVDVLVHLPAWHGIHSFSRRPDEFWHLNVDGTYHALEAATRVGVRKVVYASSAVFYGPVGVPYCFSKHVGELICDHFRARESIAVARLRYTAFLPPRDLVDYGVRMLDGSGLDRRDAGGATARAVDALLEEAFVDEAFDVVCGTPFDDRDVADWAVDPWRVLGRTWPDDLELLRARLPASLPARLPDPSAARRLADVLGYPPRYSFGTLVDQLRVEARSANGPAAGSAMSNSSTTVQSGFRP